MATATIAANAHTAVTTGWTNPSNAYATTGDNVYATAATVKNGTVDGDFGFPNVASGTIPDGARIDAVRLVIEAGLSASVTGGLVGVVMRNNGVVIGTEATKTTTTEATVTQTVPLPGVTLKDLRSASTLLKARVRATKGNTSTAMTVNLDFVRLEVDYTTQTGYPAEVFKLDPRMYFRLGETASPFFDQASGQTSGISGSGSTLDVTGCLTASGQDDGALQLANSGFIDFGVSGMAYLPAGASARSILVWFRTSATGVQPLLQYGNNAATQWVQVRLNNGVIEVDNNGSSISFGSGYNDGQNHFLALSYSGTQWTAYIDGTQVGSATAQTLATVLAGGNDWIGTTGSVFYTGVVDEPAILAGAITSTDVTNLWNAGGTTVTPKTANDAGSGSDSISAMGLAAASDPMTGADSISGRAIVTSDAGSLTGEVSTVDQGTTPKTATDSGAAADAVSGRALVLVDSASGADSSTVNTGTYQSSVLAKSPKMYLRLGETAGNFADLASGSGPGSYGLSGTGSTRGVTGALTAAGQDDGALQLANSGFIDFTGSGNASSLPAGATARTLIAWFRTSSAGDVPFITYGQGAAGAWCAFLLASGALKIDKWGTNLTFGSGLNDGGNHMGALVFDGTNWTAYVDGSQVGSPTAMSMATSLTSQNCWVGTTGSTFATGVLDEVAIIPSALTSTEIANLYAAGASSTTPKTASDSGSGVESGSTMDTQAPESGSGVDVVSALGIATSDTAAGADSTSGHAIATSDTGAGADASGMAFPTSDTGSGSDAISGRAIVTTDAGAGADVSNVGYFLTDTATGADASTIVGHAAADAASAVEVVSAMGLQASEAASGSDVSSLNTGNSFTANDSGTLATEAVSALGLQAADSGTGSDTSSPTFGMADSGSGSEVISALGLATSDSGSLTGEASGVNGGFAAGANDSGAGVDAVSGRAIVTSDSGSGVEGNGAIAYGITTVDSALGSEPSTSRGAASDDQASGVEVTSAAARTGSDSSTGSETSSPSSAIVALDVAGATETALPGAAVLAVDSGSSTGVAAVSARLTGFDAGAWGEHAVAIPPFYPFSGSVSAKVTATTLSATVRMAPDAVVAEEWEARVR